MLIFGIVGVALATICPSQYRMAFLIMGGAAVFMGWQDQQPAQRVQYQQPSYYQQEVWR